VRKILNTFIIVSLLAFLVGLSLLWFTPFTGLRFFNFTIFFLVLSISSFVFKIYVSRSSLISFFKWSIAALLCFPLIIVFFGLFEPNALEVSWPLLMSTIVFQCLIGLLSILEVFDKNSNLTLIDKFTSLFASVFSVGVMVIILLKISLGEIYTILFLGFFIMIVFFLISIMTNKQSVTH
jgi:hypothetical protein